MKRALNWLGIVLVLAAIFVPPLYARKIINGATAEFDRLRGMFDE